MHDGRLKVVTVLGTRPEIVRLSEVMRRLDEHTDHVVVHTGQNHDDELSAVFFRDLRLRRPDHLLAVDTSSPGAVYAGVLTGVERVLVAERPDAVLVLGDTNSAIGALIAKRLHVPVYHMEGGNRCFDGNVPEEVNRRVVDHVADFNLVYTERARQHLLAEGLPHRRVYLTGSPLREVLDAHRQAILASPVLTGLGLEAGGFFLASVHREENVDHPERLARVVAALGGVAAEFARPVLVSTHPRTRARLDAHPTLVVPENVRFVPPLGFLDYCRLQLDAACVLSDSGSVSEESAILGFPAVTVRESMERPEALDAGSVVLTGLDPATVVAGVRLQMARGAPPTVPWEYEVADCSERVVRLIVGTAGLSNRWAGVADPRWPEPAGRARVPLGRA